MQLTKARGTLIAIGGEDREGDCLISIGNSSSKIRRGFRRYLLSPT